MYLIKENQISVNNLRMGLFGKSKTPDPKEQVNDWCRKIRKEGNGLERQIRQIQRGEQAAIRYD